MRTRPARALVVAAMLCLAPIGAHAGDAPLQKTSTHGPVTATVALEPTAPRIGDAVTLTLTVKSAKGVEVLMPEFGEALDRYRILDFVPHEGIDPDGATEHTQRYRLLPPTSGPQDIPPLLVEFVDRRPGKQAAPEGTDAYELLTERLDFVVASVVPEGASATLAPPLAPLPPRARPAAPPWPWLAGLALLLALLAPWLVRRLRAWRRRARQRSAYDVAAARLARLLARAHPRGQEALHGFYVELSAIVRQYLEVRFELRAPEMSTEEFLAAVSRSPDLGHEHQRLLRDFLRGADLVKFAHKVPDAGENEAAIEAARRFLDETREASPLLDDATAARLGEAVRA